MKAREWFARHRGGPAQAVSLRPWLSHNDCGHLVTVSGQLSWDYSQLLIYLSLKMEFERKLAWLRPLSVFEGQAGADRAKEAI